MWKLSDALKDYRAVVLGLLSQRRHRGSEFASLLSFNKTSQNTNHAKLKSSACRRDSAESHRKFIAKHGLEQHDAAGR
ncbi:MAG: hypothetical protein MZV70_25055 [Desulfobacterales bacterium]|nr:hypothetical protein [Desulfobacterales bacterium]